MEPKDYYFSTPFEWEGKDFDGETIKRTYVIATTKSVYDNSRHLDGGTPAYSELRNLIRDVSISFVEDTETIFETRSTPDEVVAALRGKGFVHNSSLDSYLYELMPDHFSRDDEEDF